MASEIKPKYNSSSKDVWIVDRGELKPKYGDDSNVDYNIVIAKNAENIVAKTLKRNDVFKRIFLYDCC